MKRHIEMVVTASILVGYDDAEMDAFEASEEARERLNTHLELDGTGKIEIDDVRLDGIQLN